MKVNKQKRNLLELERRIGGRYQRQVRWATVISVPYAVVFHLALVIWLEDADLFGAAEDSRHSPSESIAVEVEPEPERFIQTNPEAPSNEPNETSAIAARDQQAAQPDPDVEGTMAEVEGEPELDRVVEGVATESEPLPAGVYGEGLSGEETLDGESSLPPPPLPATGGPEFLEQEPEDLDGVSVVTQPDQIPLEDDFEDGPRILDLRTPGESDQEIEVSEEESVEEPDSGERMVSPRPRPRVSPDVIAGAKGSVGTAGRVGMEAVDARFSEFGEYSQRMMEAISSQWHLLAGEVGYAALDTPSRVSVRFLLGSDGRVLESEIVHTTANRLTSALCLDAIQSRAPFGLWTRSMVETLGEETEIRIRFHYR